MIAVISGAKAHSYVASDSSLVDLISEALILRQDELSADLNHKKLKAVLDSISRTLKSAYIKIRKKSTDKNLAKKLLHIVLGAKRAPNLAEMNIAIAIEDGN